MTSASATVVQWQHLERKHNIKSCMLYNLYYSAYYIVNSSNINWKINFVVQLVDTLLFALQQQNTWLIRNKYLPQWSEVKLISRIAYFPMLCHFNIVSSQILFLAFSKWLQLFNGEKYLKYISITSTFSINAQRKI